MIDRGIEFDNTPTTNPTGDQDSRMSSARCGDNLQLRQTVERTLPISIDQIELLIQNAVGSRFVAIDELSQRAVSMGGKRLRPLLVLLAAQSVMSKQLSQRTLRDLQSVAASVELVHAASLVHDDVMDSAEMRRHQPTIVARAGSQNAVLLGDYLFTRAYALAASCRSSFPARQIADASKALCEGELRQQQSVGCWELSLADYRKILLQKTGALCAVSCRLGGRLAGADKLKSRALALFGAQLGLAFQIYDDWLDYWGSQRVGKTLGTDLAQRKPTLPLLRALSANDTSRQSKLRAVLESSESDVRLAEIRELLELTDAKDYTLKIARACAQRAKKHLDALPPSDAKACLMQIADFSVQRQD